MQEASAALQFEKAARLRDDIAALQKLGQRGDVDKDVQPEVFPIDPKKGLAGLRKVLGLRETPRTIEGVDIAHLGGERHGGVAGAASSTACRSSRAIAATGSSRWRASTTSPRSARW